MINDTFQRHVKYSRSAPLAAAPTIFSIESNEKYKIEQISDICNLNQLQIQEYIKAGVISSDQINSKYFTKDQLVSLRRAYQLKVDFGIESPNAAIALHHLDTAELLEQRLGWLKLVCMDEERTTVQ